MKINEIHVERFGVWHDLDLPLNPSGLNIFYGPNEAGKTTLMRFIRGVLYGYKPMHAQIPGRPTPPEDWDGRLDVSHKGHHGQVRRRLNGQGRGVVTLNGWGAQSVADSLLDDILSGISENVFESVFAIGLNELQELATLESDEVARQIHGLTLGPEGKKLLELTRQLDSGEQGSPYQTTPELSRLLQQERELNSRTDHAGQQRAEHTRLARQREQLTRQIEKLRGTQNELQGQLRSLQFQERIWKPWSRVQQLRQQIYSLPPMPSFPDGGVQRLDEIEQELVELKQTRTRLSQEVAELRNQADNLEQDPEFEQSATLIQSLVEQKEWIAQLHESNASAAHRCEEHKTALDLALTELGEEWSAHRLEATDTSVGSHCRLMAAARRYQVALGRRSRLRKRYDKLSDSYNEHSEKLAENLNQLGGTELDQALNESRKRLSDLEDLGRLRLRETELQYRRVNIEDRLQRSQQLENLPQWVYVVLAIFMVMGLLLTVVGFYTGVTTSGISGSIYFLLGLTGGGMAWGLKNHFEEEAEEDRDGLRTELQGLDARLAETRTTIQRRTQATLQVYAGDDPAAQAELLNEGLSEADYLSLESQRLAELEKLAVTDERLQKRRRRLSKMRTKFQGVQREVNSLRQTWCELLTQLGFKETVNVNKAMETWTKVATAAEHLKYWKLSLEELQHHQHNLSSVRQRMEDVSRRVPEWRVDANSPVDVLNAWEDNLKGFSVTRGDWRKIQRELDNKRRDLSELQAEFDRLGLQKSALLAQGGATTREEFETRYEQARERIKLESSLSEAEAELTELTHAEPTMPIVEQELHHFNAQRNADQIRSLTRELDLLEADLQRQFEAQGTLKQQMLELEGQRDATKSRYQREQLRNQIQQVSEKWFATELAREAVTKVRARYERNCQPHVLAAASEILSRMTCGKFRNLWTPLGKHTLYVDDDRNQTFTVEQLSGGTREQLFLSIRLALVAQFREKGVELPLVLDDVLVNFDQHRTEAVVETLMELTKEGQQILLFTCHQHLAHLADEKGLNPVYLPTRSKELEGRRAG